MSQSAKSYAETVQIHRERDAEFLERSKSAWQIQQNLFWLLDEIRGFNEMSSSVLAITRIAASWVGSASESELIKNRTPLRDLLRTVEQLEQIRIAYYCFDISSDFSNYSTVKEDELFRVKEGGGRQDE